MITLDVNRTKLYVAGQWNPAYYLVLKSEYPKTETRVHIDWRKIHQGAWASNRGATMAKKIQVSFEILANIRP